MSTGKTFDSRARWRDRFVEIARQVEGAGAPAPAQGVAGLRLRARMRGSLLRSRRVPMARVAGFQAG